MKELKPCVDVEEEDMELIHEKAREMIELCIKSGGVGLAAPQVGMNANLFVFSSGATEFHIAINPKWYPAEKKKTNSIEQCLSLSKEEGYFVERFKYINAVYYSISPSRNKFVKVNRKLKKNEAIVFQHECDHLEGKTLKETGVLL